MQLQSTIDVLERQRPVLGDAVVDSSVAALQKEIAGLRPSYTQERKLVTILFCDIVSSSRMAADRDPEEVLSIVDGALHEMTLAVDSFGGVVTRYMGDGILALFGAPKAQESHAEQAVRAGLAIQERMAAYGRRLKEASGPADFQVRVGINSGHVVAGGVGGEKGEYTVIGDAVNMAARFEAAAPPGGVLIGLSTFQLVGGDRLFEAEKLVPIIVKGRSQPQPVYLVRRALTVPQVRGATRAPLTGRSSELAALQKAYQMVLEAHQLKVVRVIGPAGIGKSRMRQEFLSWLESLPEPPRITLGAAYAYTGSTPFYLAANVLNAALHIVEADTMDQRREKLKKMWRDTGLAEEHLHGLAALASVKLDDNELRALDLQARREVIFESFIAFWQNQTKQAQLALVLEDTHWADDLSLDLFAALIAAQPEMPLLLIYFSRPHRRQNERFGKLKTQLGENIIEEISLQELDVQQTGRMIQGLLASGEVPWELVTAIEKHAQGNPFFIEEIVKTLLEDGILAGENGRWALTRELAEIHVPDTVQGVLAARIDRLETREKQVLQYAAIIGRSFTQMILAALFDQDIEGDLSNLRDRDFIIKLGRQALMDDWEWLFRHVLVQEVAYESVLIEVRRRVHGRIAAHLESLAGDRLDELAPTLAFHYERGHVWDRAIQYLVLAAQRSAQIFALPEALSFYNRAIELREAQADDIAFETRLDLYEQRGDVHALAYEFDGAEVDFRIVKNAAQRAGDLGRVQSLLVRLGFLFRNADRHSEAVQCLQEGLAVARQNADMHAVADTLYHLGTVAWTAGDNLAALSYQHEAIDICRRLEISDIVTVQALHGLGEAQNWAANPRQAIQNYQESITLSRLVQDKSFESENLYMLAYACTGEHGTADYDLGLQSAQSALEISRKARLVGHTTPALYVSGILHGSCGDYQKGLNDLLEAIAWSIKLGVFRFQTATILGLGSLYRELNLFERAYANDELGMQIELEKNLGFTLFGLRANLAIDRLYLGDLDVEQELLQTLDQAREHGQMIFAVDCFQGLAQWALKAGELPLALSYADQLQEVAQAGGMREVAAQAKLYRGLAYRQLGDWQTAENELLPVQKNADANRGVRLQWDAHAALEKLYRAWGKDDLADRELARVKAIVKRIGDNLQDDDLKIGLPNYS